MQIVMVSDYYAPRIGGGVERVVQEVARRLSGRGHCVRILTLNPNGHPAVEMREGVEIIRLRAPDLQPLLGVPAPFGVPIGLRRLLNDADVIHVHNLFFLLSLLTVASRPRAPVVTTLHLGGLEHLPGIPGWLGRAYERSVGRLILKRSAAVTAVSRSVASHAAEIGFDRSVRVVPNAVDISRFRPPGGGNGHHSETREVLFLGRMSKTKGPQILVDTIPQVARDQKGLLFRFVGNGPLREYAKRRLQRLGALDCVTFQDPVPDVVPVLQRASVVVRPSFTEGMPLGLLEAMACARPIVATRVSGTTEIIENGQTGVLVEPGSVPALRDGLLTVLNDDDMLHGIGERAREWTLKQMTWDSVAQRYMSVYEDVAS